MSDDFNVTVLAALVDLQRAVASLDRGQAELQKGQADLQKGQADLRAELLSTRTAIMGRIDRLQDDLTSTKDDIGVNMGTVDHLWQQIKADRDAMDGLREAITVLRRKVARLEDQRPA